MKLYKSKYYTAVVKEKMSDHVYGESQWVYNFSSKKKQDKSN